MKKTLLTVFLAASLLPLSAQAADANAAKALLKKNDCYKCHALDKKKDGPSFKEVAKKIGDDPDASKKLHTHVTTGPKVRIDGNEEEHKVIKGSEDEIQNLIDWILSLK